ncbi:MAG: IclR family transcriptional regulator [Thermaerobacter sp.]|nr:IclR family transcriptional regulator [Thermaerobacter sp.]
MDTTQRRVPLKIVQSLDRGISALELAFDGGVTPVELARHLQVDRSSAYRLLNTWVERGYLVRDAASGVFAPNATRFAVLHRQSVHAARWADAALVSLKALRDVTDETANLGVLDDRFVVFLGQELARSSVIIIDLLGRRRPAHCSALGKALLAHLSEPELKQWLHAEPLTALTPHSITDAVVLERHLASIRADGYAIDDEETQTGVRCLASPICGGDGHVVAAIGISGMTERITPERIPELARHVRAIALDTSARLGHSEEAVGLTPSTTASKSRS